MLPSIVASSLKIFGVCPKAFAEHRIVYPIASVSFFLASTYTWIMITISDFSQMKNTVLYTNIIGVTNYIMLVSSTIVYALTIALAWRHSANYSTQLNRICGWYQTNNFQRICDPQTNWLVIVLLLCQMGAAVIWLENSYASVALLFIFVWHLFSVAGSFIYVRYVAVLLSNWLDQLISQFKVVFVSKSHIDALMIVDELCLLRNEFQRLITSYMTLNVLNKMIRLSLISFNLFVIAERTTVLNMFIAVCLYPPPDVLLIGMVASTFDRFGAQVSSTLNF